MYQWQAKPDDEAACTANAVFEQGRGSPRHAEHTDTHAGKACMHTQIRTCTHTHTNSIRPTPVEFNTCLEDAAEVNVWSLIYSLSRSFEKYHGYRLQNLWFQDDTECICVLLLRYCVFRDKLVKIKSFRKFKITTD